MYSDEASKDSVLCRTATMAVSGPAFDFIHYESSGGTSTRFDGVTGRVELEMREAADLIINSTCKSLLFCPILHSHLCFRWCQNLKCWVADLEAAQWGGLPSFIIFSSLRINFNSEPVSIELRNIIVIPVPLCFGRR